ncbi:hypothetical protein VTK73DRAFT_5320 [Phialemonium thermophilum]|uniref:Uncharacterized protein n=1 Tax=Phialemonium thermophilum TaxID=223376 RepID=A0ABR3Y7B6_9PEZI
MASIIRNQFRSLPYPTADFTGKTVIVTGGNVGLGLEAARHCARLGAAKVILGCRNTEKGEAARRDIEASLPRRDGRSNGGSTNGVVEVWPLDMCSFESVKAFFRRADDELERLDVLISNAGVNMATFYLDEGYERTITVNVISTFLLALLLLPKLKQTAARFNAETHICFASSDAHRFAAFNERKEPKIFETFKSKEKMSFDRYNVSKLLDLLLSRELARQLDEKGTGAGVVVNVINPGFCTSQLFRDLPFPINLIIKLGLLMIGRTCEEGSRTYLTAITSGKETHGKYMDSCLIWEESQFVRSEEGSKVQKRVYAELMEILETIEPGISKNV